MAFIIVSDGPLYFCDFNYIISFVISAFIFTFYLFEILFSSLKDCQILFYLIDPLHILVSVSFVSWMITGDKKNTELEEDDHNMINVTSCRNED